MAKNKKALKKQKAYEGAKVLIFDIETAPLLGYVWGLWENNVALNQVHTDWCILSWSAKWLEDAKGNVYGPHNNIMYQDQRGVKNVEDDLNLLKGIWKLLDEADVVITQNGRSFDVKKLNARFVLNKMQPPSSYKHIDTKLLAQKHFAFTSNKLEYMTDKLCTKYKKLKHKEFPGFEMWKECLGGNLKAWQEMEKYNKYDVLSLEELYNVIIPWDNSINFNLFTDNEVNVCKCGSESYIRNGFYYTAMGKFQRYRCKSCGSETRDRNNLFSKEKRDSLKNNTVR